MNSKTTKRFRQMLAKLPINIQHQAREAYRFFKLNPNYPGLQFKKVHYTEPIYSARININYRAVGIMSDGEIVWFWIGPHAEYTNLLSRL